MNYKQFVKKNDNLLELLMHKFGIVQVSKMVIKIDNYPDYDISKYERENPTDYYFKNSFNFIEDFEFVVKFDFEYNKLFHFDDFVEICRELEIEYNEGDECGLLSSLFQSKDEILDCHGYETDIDQFKLHELRVQSIDNFNKKINYEGSFYGANDEINPIDWNVYSFVNIIGISKQLASDKFYKSLLSESYILSREKKYKLSFFVGYSAIESFINYEHSSAEEEKRLKDKLKELFKVKFGQIDKHQIYTSIINDFDDFTNVRNNIAHGKNPVNINEKETRDLLQFALLLIISFENNITEFINIDL